MTFVFNKVSAAIREPGRDLFRQEKRKTAVRFAMPQAHRYTNFFQRKSPRLRINLSIGHHSVGRAAPGLTLTFEEDLECGGIAQDVGVAWLKQPEQEWPQTKRHAHREKRARELERSPQD